MRISFSPFRSLLLLATILAHLPNPIYVNAQSLADLPSCAQQAGLSGITASGCAVQDIACICGKTPFIATLRQYICKSCSVADQNASLQFAQRLCATVGTSIPAEMNSCGLSDSGSGGSSGGGSSPAPAPAPAADNAPAAGPSTSAPASTATAPPASSSTLATSAGASASGTGACTESVSASGGAGSNTTVTGTSTVPPPSEFTGAASAVRLGGGECLMALAVLVGVAGVIV